MDVLTGASRDGVLGQPESLGGGAAAAANTEVILVADPFQKSSSSAGGGGGRGNVLPEGAGTPRQHDYERWLGVLQPSQREESTVQTCPLIIQRLMSSSVFSAFPHYFSNIILSLTAHRHHDLWIKLQIEGKIRQMKLIISQNFK